MSEEIKSVNECDPPLGIEQFAQLRKENAEKFPAELPPMPNANILAAKLHPKYQNLVVTEVKEAGGDMKLIRMESSDGAELAYFRPGQYLPLCFEIDGNVIERPYAIASAPEESLDGGYYEIAVKRAEDGYVSNYIVENVKAGDKLTSGAPMGVDFYSPLRDSKNIIAIAGGIGITPFRSMARAICDGTLDVNLIIIYGVNKLSDIAFASEWSEYEKQTNGRVKCVPVVAYEEPEGYEHGFISLDIIKKYADINESSIFISGPVGLINHMRKILADTGIRRKFIRYFIGGDSQFYSEDGSGDEFTLTVHQVGNVYKIKASADETILRALERAEIKPLAKCRSGECGFCRSYVISGEFEPVEGADWRRKKDKILGFIHPCISYPTSDMEIVVQRA